MAPDQNAKERYKLSAAGHRVSGSPTGVATGDGGNRLIADDLLKIEDRYSESVRRSVNQWFGEVFSSRMNDPQNGSRVVVGQRLHQNDIFGELLAKGGWTHLNFVEEFEPARRCVISVPGFEWDGDPRREAGELLWPERFGQQQIDQIKKSTTPSAFSALYLQRPTPAGGGRFKTEWFRDFEIRESSEGREFVLYDPDRVRIVQPSQCLLFGAADPAAAEKTAGNKPCFFVMMAIATNNQKDVLVCDVYRKNVPAPTALDDMEKFQLRNRCEFLVTEKNGIGLPLIQLAIQRGVNVKPVEASGSKEFRAEAAEVAAQNGKVYLLRGAPWRNTLLDELELFPASEFQDQTDALSHAVRHVNFNPWFGGPVWSPKIPRENLPDYGKILGCGDLNAVLKTRF
jgi:predicted phage terminase large subunit-like protein